MDFHVGFLLSGGFSQKVVDNAAVEGYTVNRKGQSL
jgi:hypothetical protein